VFAQVRWEWWPYSGHQRRAPRFVGGTPGPPVSFDFTAGWVGQGAPRRCRAVRAARVVIPAWLSRESPPSPAPPPLLHSLLVIMPIEAASLSGVFSQHKASSENAHRCPASPHVFETTAEATGSFNVCRLGSIPASVTSRRQDAFNDVGAFKKRPGETPCCLWTDSSRDFVTGKLEGHPWRAPILLGRQVVDS